MKHTLLSLAFFGSIFALQGQIPDYFGNNPNWSENYYGGTPFTFFVAGTDMIYMDGDSTIGSYTYHKLYKDGQIMTGSIFPPNENVSFHDHSLDILVRQESRKVYYYSETQQADALLMSYETPVGSPLDCAYCFGTDLILAIDSIQIGSEYRRLLYLDTNQTDLRIVVEGIGTVKFLDGELFGEALSDQIFQSGIESFNQMCYGQNGVAQYPELNSGTMCHLTQAGLEETSGLSIKISYNPNEELIQISGSDEDFMLTVWNSIGQAIVRANGSSASSSSLAAGVYVVTAENSDEFTSTRIVIAQ